MVNENSSLLFLELLSKTKVQVQSSTTTAELMSNRHFGDRKFDLKDHSISSFSHIFDQSSFSVSWVHVTWMKMKKRPGNWMLNLKQSSKSTAINKTPTWVPSGKVPGQPWKIQAFQLWKSPGRSCRTASLEGWNAMIKVLTVLGRFKHSAARCWKYWKSFWTFSMKDPWGWPKLALGWRDKNDNRERYSHSSFLQLMIWQETQKGSKLAK